MNEMKNYNPEELLNGFLDGELDQRQEESLFERISIDPEFRAELNNGRRIRSTALEYASTLIPSASLAEATFSKLGFTSASAIVTSTGAFTGTLSFLRRYWLNTLIFFVFSSVLTTVAIRQLRNDSPDIKSAAFSQQAQTETRKTAGIPAPGKEASVQPLNTASTVQTSEVAHNAEHKSPVTARPERVMNRSGRARTISGKEASAETTTRTITTPPVRKEVTASNNAARESAASNYAAQESASSAPAKEQPSAASTLFPSREDLPIMAVEAFPLHEYEPQILLIDNRSSLFFRPTLPPNFSVLFRALNTSSNPVAAVPSRSEPWFRNMAIGVVYSVTESQQIGVEFGQEPFAQNYSGSENAVGVRYEQNLMTGWISALYRYKFPGFSLLGEISPFASANTGVTLQAWPLLRGTAGISYKPFPYVSFLFGADATMLLYPFQSKWFTTKKVGFTYGFAISF